MLTRPSLFGFLLSRHPSAAPFLSRFSPPLLPTHNLDEVLSSLPRGVWSIWTRRNEGFYRYCFDRLLREERLSACSFSGFWSTVLARSVNDGAHFLGSQERQRGTCRKGPGRVFQAIPWRPNRVSRIGLCGQRWFRQQFPDIHFY